MRRLSTQEAFSRQAPHFEHLGCELEIVTCRNSQAATIRELNQFLSLTGPQGKRLFNINMCTAVEAFPRYRTVTLRRRCDVNDVRRARSEHFVNIGKALRNAKTFTELPGHERFQIAESNNTATGNSTDRFHVLVRNFAATDERDSQGHRSWWLRANGC